jgi:hypothetical protein
LPKKQSVIIGQRDHGLNYDKYYKRFNKEEGALGGVVESTIEVIEEHKYQKLKHSHLPFEMKMG